MPLTAIVLCFAANCSTNNGVNKKFLMKDLVAVFFGVLNLLPLGSVVADVKICGQNALQWLDGWCLVQYFAKF
jgi:hypothetical protein